MQRSVVIHSIMLPNLSVSRHQLAYEFASVPIHRSRNERLGGTTNLCHDLTRNENRDYSFGQGMLTLRTVMGITQNDLADLLGVSRRAVGAWEAGSKYPSVKDLKRFIEIAVQYGAFHSGQAEAEIRALWQVSRQKVLLNENWLKALLNSDRGARQKLLDKQILKRSCQRLNRR